MKFQLSIKCTCNLIQKVVCTCTTILVLFITFTVCNSVTSLILTNKFGINNIIVCDRSINRLCGYQVTFKAEELLTYTNINIVGQVKMLMAQLTSPIFALKKPNTYVFTYY